MSGILLCSESEIMYVVHLFTLKAHFNWDEPLLINCMWLVVPYWTA